MLHTVVWISPFIAGSMIVKILANATVAVTSTVKTTITFSFLNTTKDFLISLFLLNAMNAPAMNTYGSVIATLVMDTRMLKN